MRKQICQKLIELRPPFVESISNSSSRANWLGSFWVYQCRVWYTNPTHPTRKSKDISLCQALSQSKTNLGLNRWKTTYIFSKNGRGPQFFQKWKTTSIFSKMEDDLNKLISKPNPSVLGLNSIIWQMKDKNMAVLGIGTAQALVFFFFFCYTWRFYYNLI